MAKPAARFVCQACGAQHRKWSGKCDDCGAWNAIVEEVVHDLPKGAARGGRKIDFVTLSGAPVDEFRSVTGIGEFDRVVGGGLVPGSTTLVGGDPGIGKSTLLLQVAAALAGAGTSVYVSGEEAVDQVRMRARRMGLAEAPVQLAAATAVRDIVATLDAPDAPLAAVIDSIQTMFVDTLDSAPGTVAQVRASAQELIRVAKRRGTALLLVGHVTKEGTIAGPRVLEHMVDTVLYFEGERGHPFRILRAHKNRFGSTNEIGVFEMKGSGLAEVPDPSSLFLAERPRNVSGSVVTSTLNGTRPILVEVQALVAPTGYGTARRTAIGVDSNRVALLAAVLEKKEGVQLVGCDIFVNVAGGMSLTEPASDLAVCAALVSSLQNKPVDPHTLILGEVGLAGEVRAVAQVEPRLAEAAKMGFKRVVLPKGSARRLESPRLEVQAVENIGQALALVLA
jgi:DNA repair protein RadA/Sms